MNKMYIPFLAKQKTNAWQLAVLPCVFGMLFYFASQYAIQARSYAGQMASAALLGGALALLCLALTGGLRACAMGMCLFLAYMGGWLLYEKPYFEMPMLALIAVASAYLLVCLVRLVLPMKYLDNAARENYKSFFRIAGLDLLVFLCLVLYYGYFFTRQGSLGQRGLNLIPLRSLEIDNIIFLGNIFLFFPFGFFLRGLFRRKGWVSIAICAGFSLLMEICQWIFAIGRSDIDDLLLNTLGGALGVLAVILLGALRRKITKGAEGSEFLSWVSKTAPSPQ